MKKLHLVGFTRDIDGLILSPRKGAKTGGFVVALDEELVASIQEARHRRERGDEPVEGTPAPSPAPGRTRPTSALSPREIQSRLRAGSTIAEVAAQAGVGEEWVLRFADPILAEQGRVVESAQKLTFAKSRLGPSIEPLAESVQWNLTDRGVRFSDDVFANGWSAYNLHGARWAVRFTYSSRQRRQTAEWEVDLRERSLTARNRLASDLGHVEAGRRRPRLEAVEHGPAEVEAPPPPVVAGRGGARTRSKTAGRAAARAPAGRKAGAATKRAGGSRASAATKTTSAHKAPGRSSAKNASSARSTAGAKAAGVVSKRSGREPAPRKARGAKKPSADGPGGASATKAVAPSEPLPERPSHLARPPSPMNTANKATSLPGRRLTGHFARPGPPPPAARPPAPPRRPPPQPESFETPTGPDHSDPGEPQTQPAAPPPVRAAPPVAGPVERPGGDAPAPPPGDRPASSSPAPAAATAKSGPGDGGRAKAPAPAAARSDADRAAARVVAPPLPRPVPLKGNGDDDRPAVVILSTPPSAPGPAAPGRARIGAGRADESSRGARTAGSAPPPDPAPATAEPRSRRG